MMIRTVLAGLLTLVAVAIPHTASTQPGAPARRIGYLTPGTGTGALAQELRLRPFREGLRAQGFIEGQNVTIEYRFAQGQREQLDQFAAELVSLRVDVIVTAAAPAALAAKRATTTIPIVMVDPGDPVQLGLVNSLAHPGANVTGVTSITSALAGKRLEMLKELNSRIARVGMLWNAAIPPAELALTDLRATGAKLAIELQTVEVRGPKGFAEAFATFAGRPVDALMVFPDPLTFNNREVIIDFAAKNRLVTMYGAREFVDANGLISYGPNYPEMFRRAGEYAGRILKGVKSSDLPVEQPTRFELVINLNTAKALGLTIPSSLLLRADQLIK
jgi:putative ABC transport system substrate-binding protein